MDDTKAVEVLIAVLKKHPLTKDEKEAVLKAIGLMSWTKYAEKSIEGLGAKRAKKNEL
jgi:hypothetical protein